MFQLTDFLSVTLSRSEATKHSRRVQLTFEQYPPYKANPSAECWERLDSALRCEGVEEVAVDRFKLLPDEDKPMVLGNWYRFEWPEDDNSAEELGRLLPRTHEKGQLWHWSTERDCYVRVQCEWTYCLYSNKSKVLTMFRK